MIASMTTREKDAEQIAIKQPSLISRLWIAQIADLTTIRTLPKIHARFAQTTAPLVSRRPKTGR
jgi:hypothetical protein